MFINQRYEVLEELGKGSFGIAIKVKDKKENNNIKVIKQAFIKNLRPKEIVNTVNEALVLVQLDHPYIVKYYESFSDDEYFFIVEEYCDGGDLWTKLQQLKKQSQFLTEDEILNNFSQLISAFLYLHGKDILHRDIKSLNIFIKNNQLKLGDFGLAKNLENNTYAMTMAGTPLYFCPELCRSEPYNSKSDIWALGILLYEMCTLGFPFDSFEAILNNEAPDLPSSYSSNLNKLYKKLVEKDPENRFSIRQAKKFINEKFNKRVYEVPEKVSILKKKKYRSPSASVLRTSQNTKIPAKNHGNDSGISSQQKSCLLKNNRNYKSIVRTHVDYECDISYCVKLNVQLPTKLCFVCGKDIKIGEKYRRTNKTGKIFHEECRKCNSCDGPLGETYKFKNNSMYCHKCYDSTSTSV